MIRRYIKRDNPWELLAFAAILFFSGLFMVLQTEPMIAMPYVGRARGFGEALSPTGAHIVGCVAISVSLIFVGLYYYVRRTSPVIRRR